MTRSHGIPKATALRLSFYLRQLDHFLTEGVTTVSSARLAATLRTSAAQVRKDLSHFGQFGRPGVGYLVEDLRQAVSKILGVNRVWPVAVVGIGNLGRALARYGGFAKQRFEVVALFDNDPAVVGTRVGDNVVCSMDDLAAKVREHRIELAIVTVPAESAQAATDALVKAGVVGVLNFAPITVHVPENVALHAADITVLLEQLSCRVVRRKQHGGP